MEPTFSLRDYDEAADYLRSRTRHTPTIGLVLGSGLSGLAEQIADADTIPYGEIPHFPVSTVAGHAGQTGHRPPGRRDRLRHAGALSLLRGLFPPPDHLAHTGDATAGGDDRDPDQCGWRRQPRLCGGRHHGHHRSSEFRGHDRGQSPARPQPGGVRPALSRRESGLHAPAARRSPLLPLPPRAFTSSRASMRCWRAPTSSRRPRSACCACWAPTPWA